MPPKLLRRALILAPVLAASGCLRIPSVLWAREATVPLAAVPYRACIESALTSIDGVRLLPFHGFESEVDFEFPLADGSVFPTAVVERHADGEAHIVFGVVHYRKLASYDELVPPALETVRDRIRSRCGEKATVTLGPARRLDLASLP